MARFSINKLPKEERIRLIGEFYNAASMVKNREEAAKIFRDILDGDEIGNIMRRIDVAVLLLAGCTYEEVVKLLGVGKNKISSVHRKLARGGEGYQLLIQRILEQRKKRKIAKIKSQRKRERMAERPNIEAMKKRYPAHFLFWNILDEFGDYFAGKSEIKSDQEEVREYYRRQK